MEETLIRLAREIDEKRYGKYRAFVTDNKDPQKRGRLKLLVPSVLNEEETDWALPCVPFGGLADQGVFMIPEVDAQLWVEFEEGNINCPIWIGTFWPENTNVPKEASQEEPTTRLIKTPGGHLVQFDDKPGEEKIVIRHKKKAEIKIDKEGSIELKDAKENSITLDASAKSISVRDANGNTLVMTSTGTVLEDGNGNKIEMGTAGITVEGQQIVVKGSQVFLGGPGGEPIIKGQSFLSLFMSHIHTATPGGGPTTPPIPQGEMSTLSMKVMTG